MLRSKLPLRSVSHTLFLLTLITFGAVSPATALDFNRTGPDEFCSTLDARQQRIDSQITSVQSEVRQTWQQQTDRMKVMIAERQSSQTDLLRSIDAQRQRNLHKFNKSLNSASQKQALQNYISTQHQAGMNRRGTIEQANNAFTAAVKRYVGNRQATQAGQIEALRINLDDDLQTASGQCATGVASSEVAKAFTDSVHQSKLTYLSQRKADSAIVAQIQDLNATRREAVIGANQTYSGTMAQARQTLKAALK